MRFLFALTAIFGLLSMFTPKLVWIITESWKSEDATEPSDVYIFFTRIGGVCFFLAGLGGFIASFISE
jgi:hypothetical protein